MRNFIILTLILLAAIILDFCGVPVAQNLKTIIIFSFLSLALHFVVGLTGLLHLGIAAFMALGAYTFSILTSEIYPFQVGFWWGIIFSIGVGAVIGGIVGVPILRLRGDYLAMVTLGFGEITQDVLKNAEVITKGTQGINPLPVPLFFGIMVDTDRSFFILCSFLLLLCLYFLSNIENSKFGRRMESIRDDELAAGSIKISAAKTKILSLMIAGAVAGLSGALFAVSLSASGEPGNYDFQISVLALCMVIVGGLGNLYGALIGTFTVLSINTFLLGFISEFLSRTFQELPSYLLPSSYKYAVFGLMLILITRLKPDGIIRRKTS